MAQRKHRSGTGKRLIVGIFLALAVVLSAPTAKANTYLFSVTGQDIVSAISASEDWGSTVSSSAYFAFFFQPQGIGAFSYLSEIGPATNSPTTAWEASTITDYANLQVAGAFARFSKGQTQTQVSVVATNNMWNNYGPYHDNATNWPISWGSTNGTMTELLDLSRTFQFVIDTPETLSGPYFLLGIASAAFSFSPFSVVNPKTETNINFYLEVTPSQVPEPETWCFALGGLGLLISLRQINKRVSHKD